MKIPCTLTILGLAFFAQAQTSENDPKSKDAVDPPPREGWKLVWSDEFAGQAIDSTKWSPCERGTSDWNDTMSDDPRLLKIKDGTLHLYGIVNDKKDQDPVSYLTAGVNSEDKFSFQYGKALVRARFKSAHGAWPAIWMLGNEKAWPANGEIDLMEHLNFDDKIYQTIHSEYTVRIDKTNTPEKGCTVDIKKDDWNTYGCEWDAEKIVFTVNDKPSMTYPRVPALSGQQWPFNQPFYFILSMQIGGNWVNTSGPTDSAHYPAGMEIDWVRVYERLPGQDGAANETSAGGQTRGVPESTPVIAGKRVVGYALAGHQKLLDDPATRDFIFPNITNVVLIAAVTADAKGIVSVDEKLLGNAVAVTHSKNRKISATFAGPCRVLFADSGIRTALVTSVLQTCRKYHFDGADFDYEYPGNMEDRLNFEAFLKELRTAAPKKLLISVAVSAWDNASHLVPAGAVSSLDWVFLMAYGPNPNAMKHENQVRQAQNCLKYGIPASKLVLGLPLYGSRLGADGKPEDGPGYAGMIGTHKLDPTIDEYNGWHFNGAATI